MSILVPINGVNYIIPTPGETGWGSNLDSFFVAISAGCLQKIGGNFLLSNEVDFGAAFGLKSLYYKAETGTVATTGTIRLANADPGVVFRNNANSGNLALTTDSLDRLTYNGIPISTSGGIIELPDGSAGTPSLVFASDTPTGWYKSGSGQWAFSSEGTNTWTFGTPASQFLAIASASLNNSLIGLRTINTSGGIAAEAVCDVAAGTGGCGMLTSGSGNTDTYMGIPKANLSQFRSDSGSSGLIISTAGGGGPLYIGTSGTMALAIDTSQQVSLKGRVNGSTISANGGAQWNVTNSSNGVAAVASLNAINDSSDNLNLKMFGSGNTSTLYGITVGRYGLVSNGSGLGLFLNTNSGPMYFGTANTKALTVDTSQILTVEKTAVFSTGLQSAGSIALTAQQPIVFQDAAGSPKSVTVEAPAAVTTSYTVKWPIAQGASNQYLTNDGSGNLSWTNAAGTGTVNTGTQFQLAYYATSTNVVSGLTLIAANRALVSDTNGLPVASTTTTTELQAIHGLTASRALQTDGSGLISVNATTSTELGFVAGVTSAIQTQLNLKAPLASPTFTGQVLIPSGSVSAPGLALSASTGTGIYKEAGGNDFAIAAGGVLQLVINGSIYPKVALYGADGTVSLPEFSFENDTDCGMYRIGVNDIAFATNGIKALEIDASQQLHGSGRLNDITFSSNGNTRFSVINSNGGVSTAAFVNSDNGTSDCALYKWGTASNNTQLGVTTANFGGIIERGAGLIIETSTTSPLYIGTNDTRALTISGSSQAVSLRGTQTNDNATAGDVGETIESVVAGVSFPASTNYGDLTSITLTAGDWLVTGAMEVATGAAQNTTVAIIGISQTTGNSSTGLVSGSNLFQLDSNVGATALNSAPLFVPSYRQSLSGSTIIYLKFRASYSGTTPTASGRITAVRIR